MSTTTYIIMNVTFMAAITLMMTDNAMSALLKAAIQLYLM